MATLHLPPSKNVALRAVDLHAVSTLCGVILPGISVPASAGLSLPPACKSQPWARAPTLRRRRGNESALGQ